MNIAQKLYSLRARRSLTQTDLAKIAGTSVSAVSAWESGVRSPKIGALAKICDHFSIPLNVFIDPSNDIYDTDLPTNIIPMPGVRQIPLIGEVCAGDGIIAENPQVEEMVSVPDWIHADYALKCKGNSMINARIYDGDMVYIRAQDTVESGEIAAVQIGDEAVLKRVYFSNGSVILQPENPQFAPIIVNPADESIHFHIIGKAVAFTSIIR